MKPTPTLDPFGEAESESPSLWGPILIAILLGIATSAGVLYWRWPSISASGQEPSHSKATALFKTKAEAGSKNWDFYTSEVENLMKELREEKAAYEQKTRDLAAVEMRIDTEKKELLRIQNEIKNMRDELTQRTTEIQETEKNNLRSLARTYSNMKPSEAVAIISKMEDSDVAKLLAMMKNDVVAKILGEMAKTRDPDAGDGAQNATMAERAAQISRQLQLLTKPQPTAQ
jgi:flagellar motility protein MotE (MotC chaperone)